MSRPLYFLTVNGIVRYARSKDILSPGRDSAAKSAVCYVLGITSIDPVCSGLLFERFISAERREPPDVDIDFDFESERREEVIQWVYERYGRDRAALCATVMRFRSRGAVRDVGKVMGLPEDMTALLASQVSAWSHGGVNEEHLKGLNLADRRLRLTLQLIGVPRRLGTHSGGFMLTQDRLEDSQSWTRYAKPYHDEVDVPGLIAMLAHQRTIVELSRSHPSMLYD